MQQLNHITHLASGEKMSDEFEFYQDGKTNSEVAPAKAEIKQMILKYWNFNGHASMCSLGSFMLNV